jgi:hypothetical protein
MHRRLAACVLVAGLLTVASDSRAQAPTAKPDGIKLDVAETLQSNLARRSGEKVELILVSGKSLVGTVKEVGTSGVHLSALEGKEFYDALVRIDQVSAIVVRTK